MTMKTFILILHLYASNGHSESYVIDYDMTFEDCAAVVYVAKQTSALARFSSLACVPEMSA